MIEQTVAVDAGQNYLPGRHLLLDFWGAQRLDDLPFIEQAMRRAAEVCGATVLETRLHQFGTTNGVTGIALLAESHITIHTWPELGYAALDVFMCGACRSEDAVEPLKASFAPSEIKMTVIARGSLPAEVAQ
jgi:S-adenosylmethionine decarboxylase